MTVLAAARPLAAPDARLVARTGALLRAGVPLSLLMDLADPAGPRSAELLLTERANGDWVRRRSA